MKEQFITIIKSLSYPIFLQGSLNIEDAYPESFFTYWNNETFDDEFYDNVEHKTIWNFDLNFYSTDVELVNTILLQAKTLLRQNGFIVNGKGYDVACDKPTHTGRGINILKIEK